MKRSPRSAQRLRSTIDLLPRETREAMLRGIDGNRIIVGGYADKGSGGICPMLAAHRNGGRTNFGSFARAWDAFTGAGKKPRRATKREVHALRTYLELSLLQEEQPQGSIAKLAEEIRAERADRAADTEVAKPAPRRFRIYRRKRRTDDAFRELLAAAEKQVSEQRAAEARREHSKS